jgi:acetyl esterase/lipase
MVELDEKHRVDGWTGSVGVKQKAAAIRREVVGLMLAIVLVITGPVLAEPQVDDDGTIHLPAVSIPESSFLGKDTRASLRKERMVEQAESASSPHCPSIEDARRDQAQSIHKCEAEAFHGSSFYRRLRQRYAVSIEPREIGGVHTEVFTPVEGIDPSNRNRVLLNVHGGGFMGGWETNSHLESIPVASIGRIKVISIDYREAPEYEFPAASQDVAAVYREFLKAYNSKSIGIYGCSAGGLLTAEALAWFQTHGLPTPGAAGMFCDGADYWSEGDSGYVGRAVLGDRVIWGLAHDNPYFKHARPDDALAFPVRSALVMKEFPPSLLITSTRDPALSCVVYTHSVLVGQGVDTELHIWEGLGHAFFYDTALSESRDAYAVAVRFFTRHLGP